MILSVHQPNYFPYPGFFHKIKLSDIFVVLDNVQYAKGSNRNKIITSKGWTWITVPINKTHKFSRSSEVEINNEIFETRTNASLGYSVTNFDNKKVTATVTRFGLGSIGGLYEVENFFQSKNKEVQ